MAPPDAYKKAFYFLLVAGSLTLVLILVSLFEEWGHNYAIANLGFEADLKGHLVAKTSGDAPDMMTSTAITLVENLIRIFKIILWMILVISVIRIITSLIFETILKSASQSEIASLARTVLSIIVYIVAFFIIFQSQFPQIELAPLFTGSAILGIVVGLALQETLGNLFAGIALQADQPFQVGDVISISNRGTGIVESVSWRGVRIRTFQNKLLIISNAVLGKETIEVAPHGNLNAQLVFFSSLYTNSPSKIAQIIRETVRQVENVSQKMRPVVRIRNLGENGIDWEVKYWPENFAQHNDTDAVIRQRIWYAFNREGLNFAFPTRHVFNEPQTQPISHEDYLSSASEHLARVPIFAPLSEEEIERLADSSTRRIYAPGEAIVRKGQVGGSMYIVIKGSVQVQIPGANGPTTINSIRSNDFFGEMSLLTGEPRTANVVAEEETDVLQIKKTAIKPIFEANPELLTAICQIVEERRNLLAEKQSVADEIKTEAGVGIMDSIKKFFGLK